MQASVLKGSRLRCIAGFFVFTVGVATIFGTPKAYGDDAATNTPTTQSPMVTNAANQSIPLPSTSPSTPAPENWTVNGKDYHNVIVGQVEADRVHITYDDGIGTVMLADLPPDLQKRFNYDPAAAAKATADERAKEAASDALVAQVTAQEKKQETAQEQHDTTVAELKKNAVTLVAKVTQVLPNGVLADKMEAEYSAPVTDSMASIGGGGGVSGGGFSYSESGTTIYIETPAGGLTEGQQLSIKVARTGTYTFTDTNGASRTVEKWTKVDDLSSTSSSP